MIRMNSIPLFGKSPQSELQKKILGKVKENVFIDFKFSNSLSLAEVLMNNGVDVYIVELGDSGLHQLGLKKFIKR